MSKSSPWPQYAKTIPELFYEKGGAWTDETVFRHKKQGRWIDLSWREVRENVLAVASGLIAEGMQPEGIVAILSGNRPQWSYADLGSMSAGLINVPIYPTNTAEQVAYILEDSGSEMIFVEDQSQLEKILKVRERLPKLRRAIVIEPHAQADDFVTDMNALMERGRENMDPEAVEARWKSVDPEQVATLIYTSGTTGNPKGVMLCHRNMASNIVGAKDFLEIEPGYSDLQFLPMCHAFGRLEVYALMMYHAIVTFSESIEKLPENFKEVRPEIFVSVPRLLEKVHAKITAGVESGGTIKKLLFGWAISVGKEATRARMAGTKPPLSIRLQFGIADRLVFSKIKDALGGNIKILVYAAAPLAMEIQDFFAATGITALEGYGLTETSPGLTGNLPHDFRLGTVGKPWPDTEVKVAPDGEILAKGPQIMLGYWNNPEATAEAIEDGWFHTGDIGRIDDDGFVRITDRKKDLIITAGGKNVAPQPIELLMKMDEAIEQMAVIGDRKPYLVALIVPDFDWLEAFAKEKGLPTDRAALLTHPTVLAELKQRIEEINKGLAKYETIKRFALLESQFTVDNNMLTPTLKVRRKNVMRQYADLIESLYADNE